MLSLTRISLKRLALTGLFLASLCLLGLEIASQIWDCQPQARFQFQAPVCDPDIFLNQPALAAFRDGLQTKRTSGDEISTDTIQKAMQDLIIEVPAVKLGGLNGVACYGAAYVRADLPPQAKSFVKRHELEHLIDPRPDGNAEFLANQAAFKAYPLGLWPTVLITVKTAANYYPSPGCYVIGIWRSFKRYFLPF